MKSKSISAVFNDDRRRRIFSFNRESRQKEEIVFDDENDTVEYRQRITYTYDEALSGDLRKDDENLYVVNTPFIVRS